MLNPAVQGADKDIFRACVFANVLKEPVSHRFGEQRLPILRRPDEMYPNTYVRHLEKNWAKARNIF